MVRSVRVRWVKAWQSWWGGVMRGDVRFGRVRFVWAWGGSLGELRSGLVGYVKAWQLRSVKVR